ncbi:hypothetical protein CROQUDRAFT_671577 [Cronartium quercuum f. sp. fusiforme G11]|uniref:Uncharacterized protein n=1 Tax=Cronartium quercuum f. sp. fusiforme G11 TaxID=708437 RepID=A0A9P6TBL2_9BASI|nr:hypothetical protein CROQUDRAFT_671577 [Cronartium quercuum f. sp. fusiforme G11]
MGRKKGSKLTETSSIHRSGSLKPKRHCQPEPSAAAMAQPQSLANALGHNASVRTTRQLPAPDLLDTEAPNAVAINKL